MRRDRAERRHARRGARPRGARDPRRRARRGRARARPRRGGRGPRRPRRARRRGLDRTHGAGRRLGRRPDRRRRVEEFERWAADVARQAFLFLSVGARALRAHGGGTLIQVTNATSLHPTPGAGLWSAAHHAMRAMTLAAAQELRAEGIHACVLGGRRPDRLAEVRAASRGGRDPSRGCRRHGRDREGCAVPRRPGAAWRLVRASPDVASARDGCEQASRWRAGSSDAATRATRSCADAATTP